MGSIPRWWLVALLLLDTAKCMQSGTPSTADYCTTAPSVTRDSRLPSTTDIVPPLPCGGFYEAQEGRCCKPSNDTATKSCRNDPGQVEWELPLALCVAQNPGWNGCEGNSLDGTCCKGPGIGWRYSTSSTWTASTATVWCEAGMEFEATETDGQTITGWPVHWVTPATSAETTSGSAAQSTTSGNAAVPTAPLTAQGLAKAAFVVAAGALVVDW